MKSAVREVKSYSLVLGYLKYKGLVWGTITDWDVKKRILEMIDGLYSTGGSLKLIPHVV